MTIKHTTQFYRIKQLPHSNYIKIEIGTYEIFEVSQDCPDASRRGKWCLNIWNQEPFVHVDYATEEAARTAANDHFRKKIEKYLEPMSMK